MQAVPMHAVAWLAAATALAAVVWLLIPTGSDRAGRHPRDRVDSDVTKLEESAGNPHASSANGGDAPDSAASRAIDALRAALPAGDRARSAAAAAALRRLLRTDEEARRRAEALLLGAETPRELRMALAFVLGTLPDGASDPALLKALGLFAADTAIVRCALLALGATREPPEDDEVFEMGDRPWGQHGPGGLGITVWRSIDEPRVREVLSRHLERSEVAVREAAALSLRHTLHAAEVRDIFFAVLGTEPIDSVASELGEALAGWAGSAPEAERAAVVERLLARAGEVDFAAYRFRMEDDFRLIPLSSADRARVEDYADPGRPFGVRAFALDVLAGGAVRSGDEAVKTVRAWLVLFLAGDRDGAIRDRAARLLGTLPYDTSAVDVLAAAAQGDTAWNVRYSAVESLGRFEEEPGAREALKAATWDKDPRVAARAKKLLGR